MENYYKSNDFERFEQGIIVLIVNFFEYLQIRYGFFHGVKNILG